MRKFTNEEIITEARRLYELHGKPLTVNDWREEASMSADVVSRAFGTWTAMWTATGIDITSLNHKREQIIIDLQRAFFSTTGTICVNELIRLSGHTIPTIMKYFDSTEHALRMSRIDINKRIPKDILVEDFIRLYKELGRIPNKKDIQNHSTYSYHVFTSYFGSLDEVIDAAGLEREPIIPKVPNEKLLDGLKELHIKLGRVPTTSDVHKLGKYSIDTYARAFGSFGQALRKIGLEPLKVKKDANECPICGIITKRLICHVGEKHSEEFARQEALVVEMFKSGLSNRNIVDKENLIFKGSSSIARVIKKHLTKEEREQFRKDKIKKKLVQDYSEGKYDWINDINRKRNSTSEAREKNSAALKKAYADGNMISWNKGLTKETDNRVAEAAEQIKQTLKNLFGSGEIERKLGPESNSWKEDRSAVARRYRLGLDFTAEGRRFIKERAGYRCEICGITQEELEMFGQLLECDHVIAISDGGDNDWKTNGQALCPECHASKTREPNYKKADDNK